MPWREWEGEKPRQLLYWKKGVNTREGEGLMKRGKVFCLPRRWKKGSGKKELWVKPPSGQGKADGRKGGCFTTRGGEGKVSQFGDGNHSRGGGEKASKKFVQTIRGGRTLWVNLQQQRIENFLKAFSFEKEKPSRKGVTPAAKNLIRQKPCGGHPKKAEWAVIGGGSSRAAEKGVEFFRKSMIKQTKEGVRKEKKEATKHSTRRTKGEGHRPQK